MTTIPAEQIEQAIAEAEADARENALHALDMARMEREIAVALLKKEKERSEMLLDALETIRAVAGMYGIPTAPPLKTIDKLAREVLRITGETP